MEFTIVKPEVDNREYSLVQLENGLEVLLISDVNAEKSSGCMDVHVGHLSDPAQISGMAHFCEHLLFMGTHEFPVENEYSQFLSAHSGSSNAYTSAENTNYYFDITSDHFYQGLIRFSSFFKSPLFSESCKDRELLAVDSEHKKNLQQDNWRLYQLEKDTSAKGHAWNKFGTGNLTTLKTAPEKLHLDLRTELLDFYDCNYSANIMKCVLLGRESISKLKEFAQELFSGIQNKYVQVTEWDLHPLQKEQLEKIIFVKSIKDVKELVLEFPFPDLRKFYRKNPCKIISHLIGHEGDGSILAFLKKNGWALELSAGLQAGGTGFSFFKLNIEMTDQGLKNYSQILKIIFQYIEMMKHQLSLGVLKWIFHECQLLGEMNFRFKEQSAPARYTSRLACQMHEYLESDILSGPYLLKEFDPDLIKECMNYLRKDNFRLFILAKHGDFTGSWEMAEHYGTEYQIFEFPDELKTCIQEASMCPDLHLPRQNEFVPEDLSVRKHTDHQTVFPTIFRDSDLLRIWYKKDDTFFVPKAYCWISIKSPLSYDSPLNSVLTNMYCAIVDHTLNETSYYAECAGLSFNLESTVSGIVLHLSGFNDKLHVLLDEILKCMLNLEIQRDIFDNVAEQVKRELKNFDQEVPYHHAMYFWSHALQEKMWTYKEKLLAFDDVSLSIIQEFSPKLLSNVQMEAFIHGNYEVENVARLCTTLEKAFSHSKPISDLQIRTYSLENISPLVYAVEMLDPGNVNCAIEFYLQTGAYSDRLQRCKLLLFQQICHEPVFDFLRTKEQLGYIVFDGIRKPTGFIGYRIIVQSEKYPIYLESRIEVFLEQMEEKLRLMMHQEFEKHQSSLILKLTEKYKNLSQEAGRLWSHIQSGYYEFDQNIQDASIIKDLNMTDIQTFYSTFIKKNGQERKKFSVHIQRQDQVSSTADGKVVTIDTLPLEKKGWKLGPRPSPVSLSLKSNF